MLKHSQPYQDVIQTLTPDWGSFYAYKPYSGRTILRVIDLSCSDYDRVYDGCSLQGRLLVEVTSSFVAPESHEPLIWFRRCKINPLDPKNQQIFPAENLSDHLFVLSAGQICISLSYYSVCPFKSGWKWRKWRSSAGQSGAVRRMWSLGAAGLSLITGNSGFFQNMRLGKNQNFWVQNFSAGADESFLLVV